MNHSLLQSVAEGCNVGLRALTWWIPRSGVVSDKGLDALAREGATWPSPAMRGRPAGTYKGASSFRVG